jgi:NTP pyrophosphatase (non-canonical NTP hydrolase)
MTKSKDTYAMYKHLAEKTKADNFVSMQQGDIAWHTILLEEVYEAFSETNPAKQREEMVQVAAVAVQIIEYLDRKMEANI